MTYPTRSPAVYIMDAYADLLKANSVVHDLLFPSWNATAVNPDDQRIYRVTVDFSRARDSERVAAQLPRVLVGSVWSGMESEQEDLESASGPAKLFTHCFVPSQYYLHGDMLDMAVRNVLLSTTLADSRIIAAGLYPVGQRREERERSFNDAWRFTSEFRVANVGVLVDE